MIMPILIPMKKIISLVWALLTGAVVLAVANSSAMMSNATNTTSGNISALIN
jgi:hypothetical protein